MKTLYKQLILFSLTLFMIIGCSEDFVDVPTEGADVEPGDLTLQGVERLVAGVYNELYEWNVHSFSAMGMGSIASDDADKGSSPGDTGSDKHELDAFTFNATSGSFRGVWEGNFKGIKRANYALEALGQLTGEIDEALIMQRTAELRFLRAYYYFNLTKAFGDIPIVDRTLDPTNEEDFAVYYTRDPQSEVWAFIEADLNYAKDNLAPKGTYDVGRITNAAAATFLAKIHMYQNEWQEVLDLTNAVLGGVYGSYSLHPNVKEIWRETGENNSGSIWEIQCYPDDADNQQAIQQYTTTQGVRGMFGWGFNSPSEELTNAFESGDPRLDATIIFEGETMWDGVQINATLENPRYSEKMYVSRVEETWNGNNARTNKNMRVLRLAHVYLMNAEAANELGQTGLALQSLEAVRARARGSANVLPEVTTTNQMALREAIWHERRIEFAMEWDRFYDVIRQGRGVEEFGDLGFQAGKHELYPVPQIEIDASEGLMTQNPGY